MVQENSLDKVIVILGPTGIGKSKLALECAKRLNGEIISADSMQIYKGLNIGTAKPSKQEREEVPHHLIDIRNFNESYNAFEFVEDCKNLLKNIIHRNKTPIIVGGTNLYISALIKNYNFQNGTKNEENSYKYITYCLTMDREKLYNKINSRVDEMMQKGLLSEVETLKNNGLTINTQAGKSIGYKEILQYLNNEFELDFAINKIKQHSRNYAKRQLTWLRSMDNLIFLNSEDFAKNIEIICKNYKQKTNI